MALRHTRREPPLSQGRGAGELGETLIEVVFTVLLLGLGFVAILSSFVTTTHISAMNRDRTRASLAVQAFAEGLLKPAGDPRSTADDTFPQKWYTYEPCANPGSYGFDYGDGLLPTGYTATIVKVRYLQGAPTSSGPTFVDMSVNDCISQLSRQVWVDDIGPNPCDRVKIPTPPEAEQVNTGCQLFRVDKGLQEITIRIDSGPRKDRIVDTLVLIKRDQRCPTTYSNADLGPC